MFKLRSSNYLAKLILFGLTICTLPVIVFGGISFSNASATIEDKVIQEKVQVLHQTQMRMEQALKTLDSSMTQFSMSTQVYDALQQDITPNNYRQADMMLEGMQRLQSFDLPVQNVYLISLEHRWLLHNSGVTQLSDAVLADDLSAFLDSPKNSFWAAGNLKGLYVPPMNSSPFYSLNMVKKLPVYALNPKGLIVAQMSPFALNDMLLSQSDGAGETIVVDENGKVLAHSDQTMLGTSLASSPYMNPQLQANADHGHFSIELERTSEEVIFRKSAYNDWTYMSIVPLAAIGKESRDMGKILILNGVIILALTFVIVFQGSRGMYSPIRKLYMIAAGERKQEKEHASRDEIGMIQQRILSLQRTQVQMAEQIRSDRQQLKDLFVLKLLQGAMRPEEIEEKCGLLGIAADWSWMSVLTLHIDELEAAGEGEPDYDWALLSINRLIAEMIPEHLRLNPVLIRHMPAVLIGTHQESAAEFKTLLYRTADLIQQEMKRHLALVVSIGVSRPYRKLEHSGAAYEESCEALKYRIRLGKSAVLFIEDVEPGRRRNPFVAKPFEDELLGAIQMGDTERTGPLFGQFMQEMLAKEMTHREYQTALLHLLAEVLSAVQNAGETAESVYPDEESLFDRIFELTTAQEIEAWFSHSVIMPAAQAIERRRAVMYKSISEKVIGQIIDNYDQDLTLELCASRINYHASYVKQVFRKETGMNFSDYLSSYRMNMAKRWLVDTDMKISDIAEKLRYTNSQNFIRSFRKIVGVTPGQFRQAELEQK
ncbi:AraC family transcriptional regulator [Paenibacillus thalictri]|uniref:AraC family transcriptional regulator n=1 Tax=Paenibacillus thalictri TaxID=2527873 RepID=A0A4V2J4Q6_9BACL|nr:AraC family transcriptional regulator [Paenibacillus thalictri]TBL80752.1 AraC family transcriptional regulator [Paenibacillus thalictri]